jgi:hypothetical protein
MHLGYDAGRYDHVNLVVTLVAILLLINDARPAAYIVLPVLLSLGLLIHEAFLFINVPLIVSISYNEIINKRHPKKMLYLQLVSITATLLAIFTWGEISAGTLEKIQSTIISSIPWYDPSNALLVWNSTPREILSMAYSKFDSRLIRIHLIAILPLLMLYISLYKKILDYKEMRISRKLVFLSPFALLPLFFLGVDFFRWISLIIILMFI